MENEEKFFKKTRATILAISAYIMCSISVNTTKLLHKKTWLNCEEEEIKDTDAKINHVW